MIIGAAALPSFDVLPEPETAMAEFDASNYQPKKPGTRRLISRFNLSRRKKKKKKKKYSIPNKHLIDIFVYPEIYSPRAVFRFIKSWAGISRPSPSAPPSQTCCPAATQVSFYINPSSHSCTSQLPDLISIFKMATPVAAAKKQLRSMIKTRLSNIPQEAVLAQSLSHP